MIKTFNIIIQLITRKSGYFFSFLAVALMSACTSSKTQLDVETKNNSMGIQTMHRITSNLSISSYEGMYQSLYDIVPLILEDEVLIGLCNDSTTLGEISFENLVNELDYSALRRTNSYYRLDVIAITYLNAHIDNIPIETNGLIEELLAQMHEEIYVTEQIREDVFQNVEMTDYDAFVICLSYAVNNYLFEQCFGRTLLIKDNMNRAVCVNVPECLAISSMPISPLTVYETVVDDLDDFDLINVMSLTQFYLESTTFDSFYEYKQFIIDEGATLAYSNTSTTERDCYERYDQEINDIRLTAFIEFGIDVIIIGAFGAVTPVGAAIYLLKIAVEIRKIVKDCDRALQSYQDCLQQAVPDVYII